MNRYDELLNLLNSARAFGFQRLETGVELIGHVPHVAPQAYFHQLYPPLTSDEIDALENRLRLPFPLDFRDLLLHTNGMTLFSSHLRVFGARFSYVRQGLNAWQPLGIEQPNIQERPADAPSDALFIGSYFWDGSRIYMTGSPAMAIRARRGSSVPLNSWPGLWEMLISEARRLAALFDDKGRPKDPDQPTNPVPSR
jgi:SMI1 / KNR4 family (SUKH-1)